jgi:hypothetical protein
MKRRPNRLSARLALAGLLPALCGCAIPATEVNVPTMPMRQALDLSRSEGNSPPGTQKAAPRLRSANPPPGAAQPLLSTPEVRLAYVYEWVDPEGNKHFGEWVAIPIAGFDWIMNDGTHAPLDPSAPARVPAPAGETH